MTTAFVFINTSELFNVARLQRMTAQVAREGRTVSRSKTRVAGGKRAAKLVWNGCPRYAAALGEMDDMATRTRRIQLLSNDSAEATREAANLRSYLLASMPGKVEIDIAKEDQNTQDFGATLVLAFGTPAILALAEGIADWIRARSVGSSIKLRVGNKTVELTGPIADSPKRVEELVRLLR